MTSGEKYKITEEDIKEYGGEGMCEHLEECGHKLDSKVCGLNLGWNHPQCPVNIVVDERMSKNPDFLKKMQRGHQVMVESDEILKRIRERKERQGKARKGKERQEDRMIPMREIVVNKLME